ncbi:MAG: aminoacyl-tRNA hydrolase [Patescibacteria group bacterium]
MRVIIGLGNPGSQYQNTRHNAGYLAIDYLAARAAEKSNENLTWEENKRFQALIYKSNDTIFAKPLSYMNASGRSAQAILNYYHLLPKKIGLIKKKDSDLSDFLIVIHDDIDIELGKMKISLDSRSAGHRGVESIIQYLKTKNFTRIRLGINSPAKGQIPTDKFVLQKFSPAELKLLEGVITSLNID